jgi:hypothetical protein
VDIFDTVKERRGTVEDSRANSSEDEMPGDEEDGVLEVEGIVKVVVVNDDRGGEDNPDWNDCGRGELVFGSSRHGLGRLGGCG